MRVGEHADVVERLSVDERRQLVDVGLGLAREADDEGGAERDAGHARRGCGRAACRRSARVPGRFMRLSTGVRRVLQRQVDVLADLLALGHRRRASSSSIVVG